MGYIWNTAGRQLFLHFFSIILLSGTNGQCEFPTSFQGEYVLSKTGSLVTVNPNNITGITLPEALILEKVVGTTYNCIVHTDSKYVLRSANGARVPGESEDRYVYFCMDLTIISTAKSTYVQATQTGPGIRPYDSKYLSITAVGADPMSTICDIPQSSYLVTQYSVLLKTSEQVSWPQTCPADILGIFTSDDPTCPVTADVCADNRYIQLGNTSSCVVSPFFTANGSLTCVHEVRSGNISYIHLYNNDNDVDNTDTFRYTCVALEKTAGGILMSQDPGDCAANQQPDTATTDGKTTFNFSIPDTSKLCPITTTSTSITSTTTTSTTTTDGGLSTAASVGLALGLLGLLALLVLLILCVCIRKKKQKRKMEEEARLRDERRAERRRRRRERRNKRIQEGMPPDEGDSDSSDSGYSGRSSATLVRTEDEEDVNVDADEETGGDRNDEEAEREEQEGMRRTMMRRIYDVDGNLLYEQEISEGEGNEELGENMKEETPETGGKKKKVKKTRKHVRDKTLPDGTVVQEIVESEYWSTDSETSTQSWQGDPVRAEIQNAKLKRKRDRRSMLERSTGKDRVVPRPEVEWRLSPERKSLFTLPKIFQRFARDKRTLPDDVTDIREIPDSDRFLPQYRDKKQTEWRLEDEGFWDDPKAQMKALEIFDFDNLDAQLDESVKSPYSRQNTTHSSTHTYMPQSEGRSIKKKGKGEDRIGNGSVTDLFPSELRITSYIEADIESRQSSRSLQSRQSRECRRIKLPTIEGPSVFVSGSHDDTCEELPSIVTPTEDKIQRRATDRQRVLASLSRLLTDRLFPADDVTRDDKSPQSAKVIFVEECPKGTSVSQQRPSSQSETRGISLQNTHAGDNNGDEAKIETSKSVELPPLTGQSHYRHKYTSRRQRHIGPERAAMLRRGLLNNQSPLGRLTRTRRPTREAWSDPNSQNEEDYTAWPIKKRESNDPVCSPLDDIEYTKGSRDVGYLDLDDARLRRLLEELYKDKKYMDALIAAEVASSDDEVKSLAEHGRDYLLQMALYWEQKGPLPPRPSTTALGFKMERVRTANTRRVQTARTAPIILERNKTVF